MTELMLHFMQDILYAEKSGLREMAKIAKVVESQELKELILQHRDQSQQQVSRLERVFDLIDKRPKAKVCTAMNGLVEEMEDIIDESDRGPVRDAALIAGLQAVEHYEIARYGAMIAWAKQAGLQNAADLLQQTLDEEKESDRLFSELAERSLNPEVAEIEETEEHEEPEPEAAPPPRKRAANRKREPEPEPELEEEPEPAPPPKRRAKPAAAKPAAAKPAAAPKRTTRK
ncbi:MAG: ferritin-like domain-containing protein [Pseudomonadota bacterium]|nr:ferritin-like domain-containing protein [Pseudomonadota bacterium]